MRGGFYSKFGREHEGSFQAGFITRRNLAFYGDLLTAQWKLLAAALLVTILQAAASLTPPLIAQRVIDEYLLPGNLAGLLPWMLGFFALYAASWFFAYQQRLLSQTAGQRAVSSVRERLFVKLMSQPLSYHEKQQKGALTSLMMNDVNALSSAVTDGVVGLVSDVLTLGAMIWIMSRLHPGMTLLLLATLPVVLLIMSFLGGRIRNAFREVRERMAELNTQVEENFSGIRVVQSLGIQQQQEQDFFQVSELNLQAGLKAMMLLALVFPLTSLTTGAGTALLLWYGGRQVVEQSITLGVFAAFLAYLRKFYQPLRNLSDLFSTYLAALASMDRIMAVLEEPNPLTPERPLEALPEPFQGAIEFDRVSYGYDESGETSQQVLKDLTLRLKPGEHLGITGTTGAGKTTLMLLMLRMMDPLTGEIRVDGVPLRRIPHKQLHQLISVVPQEVFLFSGTIRENIRFGKPGADDREVMSAAKNAMAHDMIMGLPKGYDTLLGEGGVGLSGGQRQLIAFARALIRNAPVLLLDEATASMDVGLERRVQHSLERLLKDRTALVIAHRLSTLRKLDRICVLSEGQLTACGSHAELISKNPYYRQLLESGSTAIRPINGG